jgi:VanZ family protein
VQARRLIPWLPAIAWAGLIFALSSIPSLGTGLGFWDLLLRKLAHAGEFGLLALLVWRGLRQHVASPYLPAAIIAAGYAATDEYHQTFVSGRVGSVSDWTIDAAGVAIALVALRLWLDRRRSSIEAPRLDELPENPS